MPLPMSNRVNASFPLLLHDRVSTVYVRLNMHRIYIELDYVEFTQGKIYSD